MRFSVTGVPVDAVQIPDVISTLERWIAERQRTRYVAVTGMHGVSEAQRDPAFRCILCDADLVVPDGMPLVWLGRIRGHALKRRVYGPELMRTFCLQTAGKGYRHFLYGGAPGVADLLARKLREASPDLNIVGIYTPPFRELTADEDEEIIRAIHDAGTDVLWIGLSTPKQERWMHAHRDRLHVPVMLGVGAAFDMNAGLKTSAPVWMQEHGLEWLFRLLQEPARLWRRYLFGIPRFTAAVCLEAAGWRRFDL